MIGNIAKHVRHKVAALIALEYSSFAMEGQPDLRIVVHNRATPADANWIKPGNRCPTSS